MVWVAPAHGTVAPAQFAKAFERARDSVVGIEATIRGKSRRGSGFVASADGLVVCASQTVEQSKAVRVRVGGAWRDARVVALDGAMRVALLKIDVTQPLHPMAVARVPHMPLGSWVIAVEQGKDGRAHPVAGTVAVVPNEPGATRPGIILVDAPASPGSPLVNLKGEVVGISLGRITARRGRAIELKHVKEFLRKAAAASTASHSVGGAMVGNAAIP